MKRKSFDEKILKDETMDIIHIQMAWLKKCTFEYLHIYTVYHLQRDISVFTLSKP